MYNVNRFCKDDISLIENYEAAMNSPETWDCHHRLETELNLLREELKEQDLYYNRPASELIFLTHGEHTRLHMYNKTGENHPSYGKHSWNYGLKGVQVAWNKGMTGEKSHMYGTKRNEETRKKQSKQKMGEKNPMYGKPANNKGKKRYTREDGTHYYA